MPKIKTTASKEAMRWTDDGPPGEVEKEPSQDGNDFDIRMQHEADGMRAAHKIVDILKERGVCMVQANAPQDLVVAAVEEAEELWDVGQFDRPLKVYDDRSMLQVQCWKQALEDEEKVYWIRTSEASSGAHITNALKALSMKIADFGGGLGELLRKEAGIDFDRFGQAMLSCYTGDRKYTLHLDNCHGDEDDETSFPDNGMRLTLVYYINLYWDPVKRDNGGGLDIYLSDPKEPPQSASAAKSSKILRIAPHADTLVLFLSERMAHQVVPTTGSQKLFALTLWCLNGDAMGKMTKRLWAMRQAGTKKDDESDED